MRSDANFRLSECQPRPRFGSSAASVWALCHQKLGSDRPTHREASVGAGSTGPSPVPALIARASSKASNASSVTGVVCS